MPDPKRSLQQLLNTNFGTVVSGYVGSQGATGYVGSAGTNGINGTLGYTGSAGANGASVEPSITAISYPGNDTAADTAGGQTITLTGTGFATGATVIVNGSVASVVSVVSSTTITFTSPAIATGSYAVYVVNTDGGTAIFVPGIQYSGTPTWTTSAGSIGSPNTATSFSANVVATGDAPITYSVYSGSLPSGLTLAANTGVISGTTPSPASTTTYNFTIRATDAQQQDTDRAFSITVSVVTVPATIQSLVIAGGGGAPKNNYVGGGAGGGGYSYQSSTPVAGVAYSITVGGGGTGATNGNTPGTNGGDSGISGGAISISATGGYGNNLNYNNSGNGNSYGTATNYIGAGGGGAGAAAVGNGPGGAGILVTSGYFSSNTDYYGGGGAGGVANGNPSQSGGSGGGGASATAGTVNTGGGGGGGSNLASTNGGNGGSGIVIIRYPDTYLAPASTTGSPTITVSGGYRIYKWTSSGSITF